MRAVILKQPNEKRRPEVVNVTHLFYLCRMVSLVYLVIGIVKVRKVCSGGFSGLSVKPAFEMSNSLVIISDLIGFVSSCFITEEWQY